MYSIELKIKRLSLAAEARIIKAEEQRCLGWLYPPVVRSRTRRGGFTRKLDVYERLHNHRTAIVRWQARAAHLAHGYLRARPYATMEDARTRTPPPFEHIVENLRIFGGAQFKAMERPALRGAVYDWTQGGAPVGVEDSNPRTAGSAPDAASTPEMAEEQPS